MVEFNKVINGSLAYAEKNIFSKMTNAQQIAIGTVISIAMENPNKINEAIINNPFLKMFGLTEANGEIDIECVLRNLKKVIEQKGELVINLPPTDIPIVGKKYLFGEKLLFVPRDVDELYREITGGNL